MKTLEEAVTNYNNNNPYIEICNDVFCQVSLEIQRNKCNQAGIFDAAKQAEIIKNLKTRPALLAYVADYLKDDSNKMENFVEVGTAQGLQSLCFSESFPDANVFTCDIVDHRSQRAKDNEKIKFFKSDSLTMCSNLKDDVKFDFCWIDGGHQSYDVVHDFLSLSRKSHENTVWAFDDFDERFGCYSDILIISRQFEECVVLDLGLTASGNPNKILLAKRFKLSSHNV